MRVQSELLPVMTYWAALSVSNFQYAVLSAVGQTRPSTTSTRISPVSGHERVVIGRLGSAISGCEQVHRNRPVIRSPRRHERAAAMVWRGQAPWQS